MQGEKIKTRVMREIVPPWDEIMEMTERLCRLGCGEVRIKIHQGRINRREYTLKRDDSDKGIPLDMLSDEE
jgi:hypothetical protein